MQLLVLDNYDSFTYNLVHLVEKVSEVDVIVRRNDEITLDEIKDFNKILLSPGPGLPKDAGIMPELIRNYYHNKNILGICLGMQAIGEFFGAELKNLKNPHHGLAEKIKLLKQDILFDDCPKQFKVGRYHSWVLENANFPESLEITAIDEENEIMAIRHKQLPIKGVQFHPESILSEYGERIMANWLNT